MSAETGLRVAREQIRERHAEASRLRLARLASAPDLDEIAPRRSIVAAFAGRVRLGRRRLRLVRLRLVRRAAIGR